ncbi:LLM class flavin-dependent oxidoreductase [Nakamurella leprariae]|uniref:LLM class flavin-dependent oxidoreductase n=1 Tax=Nakamurella leprariae TaxID=2803911 RepID=A0A938YHI7_9ACTN|nr:LLM class flavin-dependent oxidoreductase [Nakamurella leprariae]MBM9469596.1 LLM class flavin-dependent oxidoreductase [Nakamurella leprariae]
MTARPFRLGFFTHANTTSAPAEANEELVRLFVGAEELGYDIGFLAQHLLVDAEEGSAPSPLVSLGPVAVATDRIDIGVSVVTLPVTDPVQLVQDALTLDGIARGRLHLGLGTGNANIARYAAYGVSDADPARAFDEHLEVFLDTLAGHPIRGSSDRIHTDGTGLAQRLWRSPGRVETARQAARSGLGVLFGTATLDARTQQRPIIDAYLDEWRSVGPIQAPPEFRPLVRPRLGGIRMIHPANSRPEAIDELTRFIDSSRRRLAAVSGINADAVDAEQVLRQMNLKTGTPAETAAAIRDDVALLPDADYVIAVTGVLEQVEVGHGAKHTVDVALRGLERIARDTAPLLGWTPAA